MGTRRKGRELALKLLFQADFSEQDGQSVDEFFWASNASAEDSRSFAEELHREYLAHEDQVNELIQSHARNWKLHRMSAVDRNILRVAVAEALFMHTPFVVAIDEAIEVARKYSGDESTEFVNGILDSIMRQLDREKRAKT